MCRYSVFTRMVKKDMTVCYNHLESIKGDDSLSYWVGRRDYIRVLHLFVGAKAESFLIYH